MDSSTVAKELVDAIRDAIGIQGNPVALHEPCIGGNEWKYIKECLDTGWVSSVGSYVDLFEKMLARRCGVSYAVSVVNGTEALHIALMLAGVGRGDEVLMPTLTFVATANAVSYCGAVPHFVDCEKETPVMDIVRLSEYLEGIVERKGGEVFNKNTGRRISAIIPVHVFGQPVDMDALQLVAERYNIPVVADAAESLGSLYKGKPVESFSLLSIVSFNGNKIVTTGGGGAILTDDAGLAAKAKHLTTTAKLPHRWDFIHDEIGYNFRMPNINAAMGCAQLEQLDGFLEVKRRLAKLYEEAFSDSKNFDFMTEPEYAKSNNWLNAVYIKSDDVKRDEVLEVLHDAGLMCRPVWRLMHRLDMYRDCPHMDLSVSEEMEKRVINLPSGVKTGIDCSND